LWRATNDTRKRNEERIMQILGDATTKKFTPYILSRHSLFTNLAEIGTQTARVSRIAGHESEETTKRQYIGHELKRMRGQWKKSH